MSKGSSGKSAGGRGRCRDPGPPAGFAMIRDDHWITDGDGSSNSRLAIDAFRFRGRQQHDHADVALNLLGELFQILPDPRVAVGFFHAVERRVHHP